MTNPLSVRSNGAPRNKPSIRTVETTGSGTDVDESLDARQRGFETFAAERAADAGLPVGGERAEVADVDEAVVVEVPAESNRAPVCRVRGEGAQARDIDLAVKIRVASVSEFDEDGGAVDVDPENTPPPGPKMADDSP